MKTALVPRKSMFRHSFLSSVFPGKAKDSTFARLSISPAAGLWGPGGVAFVSAGRARPIPKPLRAMRADHEVAVNLRANQTLALTRS